MNYRLYLVLDKYKIPIDNRNFSQKIPIANRNIPQLSLLISYLAGKKPRLIATVGSSRQIIFDN